MIRTYYAASEKEIKDFMRKELIMDEDIINKGKLGSGHYYIQWDTSLINKLEDEDEVGCDEPAPHYTQKGFSNSTKWYGADSIQTPSYAGGIDPIPNFTEENTYINVGEIPNMDLSEFRVNPVTTGYVTTNPSSSKSYQKHYMKIENKSEEPISSINEAGQSYEYETMNLDDVKSVFTEMYYNNENKRDYDNKKQQVFENHVRELGLDVTEEAAPKKGERGYKKNSVDVINEQIAASYNSWKDKWNTENDNTGLTSNIDNDATSNLSEEIKTSANYIIDSNSSIELPPKNETEGIWAKLKNSEANKLKM